MEKEIELKVFIGPNGDLALPFLRDLQVTETLSERDIYYTSTYRDFIASEECLRIRQKGAHAELTWKPPTTEHMRAESQYWKEEINIQLGEQAEVTRAFLERLGFIEYVVVTKKRRVYKLDSQTKVMLDAIEGIGSFVEIETFGEDAEAGREKNLEVLRKLGLQDAKRVSRPYRDIVKDGKISA